jgi:hypothetical protein
MGEEQEPLFLFTTHRSGGTLLSRIINAHPDIVIWGEHAGVLNKLAEIDEILRRHQATRSAGGKRDIEKFLRTKTEATHFDPWVSRVSEDTFVAFCRGLVQSWFDDGLAPGQRWGLKEIRYHRPETASFLLKLFPRSRFIILRRNLVSQCVSIVLANWSASTLAATGDDVDEARAKAIVDDCAYALVAINSGLISIAKKYPGCCLAIDYSKLLKEPAGTIGRLYNFAGLRVSPDVISAAERMMAVRSGATPTSKALGALNREFIERNVRASIAAARQEIRVSGIDYARLVSREGKGRYSCLVGDKKMQNTHRSTMF